MNAGFSSLTKAKKLLLPAAMRSRTDFDDAIESLGLAVVEMMEGYCARRFAYQEDLYLTEANGLAVCVPRYPVAVWTAIELQREHGGAWEDASGQVARREDGAGLLHFRHAVGSASGSLKVRYTGGYFWDTTEDASAAKPEGAPRLPAALLTAWTLQMQAIAQAQDLFGTQAGNPQSKGKENTLLPTVNLLPQVELMLNPFRRFAA